MEMQIEMSDIKVFTRIKTRQARERTALNDSASDTRFWFMKNKLVRFVAFYRVQIYLLPFVLQMDYC